MIILGIIQFILISIICFFEFKRKSPSIFLWATLFIMFAFMHLITSINNYTVFSDETIIKASLFVILFCVLYLFIRIVFYKLEKKRLKYSSIKLAINNIVINKKNIYNLLVLLSIVILFRLIPFIISSDGLLSTSWSSGRKYTASLDYLNSYQVISILYYIFAGVLLISIYNKNWWISVVTILLLLSFVILTRNRIEVLPLFVGIITFWIFKTDKIKIRTIFIGLILIVIVVYVVYGLRVFRHYGTIESFLNNFNFIEFNNKVFNYLLTDNGELGLREDFYYFIENDNNFENFGKGHSYIRMLLVFIPTSWSLGLKPPDFAQSMGAAVGMVLGGSTHPTLFGDCFANFGFLGILMGIFWGIYVCITDTICINTRNSIDKLLIFSLFGVTFAIIGRGSVYNSFVFVAWGLLLLFIYRKIICYIFPKLNYHLF